MEKGGPRSTDLERRNLTLSSVTWAPSSTLPLPLKNAQAQFRGGVYGAGPGRSATGEGRGEESPDLRLERRQAGPRLVLSSTMNFLILRSCLKQFKVNACNCVDYFCLKVRCFLLTS